MFNTLIVAAALTVQSPDTLSTARIQADRSSTAVSGAPLRKEERPWMDRAGEQELSEVLRSFAGISIRDYGGSGGLKTVSIRGFGAQHTAVSYDGLLITDLQNGQVDISEFNLDNIESVSVTIGQGDEILRSARSLAGAGVLELKSARPDYSNGKTKAWVKLGAGSYGRMDCSGQLQQALSDKLSFTANLNLMKDRGDYPYTVDNGSLTHREFRLGAQSQAVRGEMNLYGDFGQAGELRARLSGTGSDRGLPGPVILYTQDPTEHLWERSARASAVWSASPLQKLKVEAKGSFDWHWNRYTDNSDYYPEMEDERFDRREGYLSLAASWDFCEHLVGSIAEDLSYGTLSTSFEDCPFPSRLSSLSAASLQYRLPAVTVTASLLGTWIKEWVKTGAASPQRKRLSPAISAAFHPGGGFHLRASWKDGFRAPTFNDLYYSKIGNTALRPEQASQTNVGVSWAGNLGRSFAELGLDLYHNDVKDKIVATPTMFIWRMRNLGKVSMDGLDLTAKADCPFGKGWSLHTRAAYSFQYAVDMTDPSSKSWKNQIPYTPRNSGSAAAGLDTPWLTVCWTLSAVGERFVLGQNKPSNRMAPYWDHGVSLSRRFHFLGEELVSFEALNLLDSNYEVIKNYPMIGRHYRMTIKITL